MTKVLFLIHDLGQGGAEKVLVNLVNHMDRKKFDISVVSLFGGGVNEQFLNPEIHYRAVFPKMIPGNTKLMKLLSPKLLHKWFIKDKYDIEISYLEGPSARIISGCQNKETKLVTWIHVEQHTMKKMAYAFRTYREAVDCYNAFDKIVCVSQFVKKDFDALLNYKKDSIVLYNTIESDTVRELATEECSLNVDSNFKLVAVGTLKGSKGYGRLLEIIKRLHVECYPIHLYILGEGPLRENIEKYIQKNGLEQIVTLLGYQTNPYKYVAKADLFVCASFAEGFSTAVTESLVLGTPVCTVDVSGMKELLGENNEYGIVTENSEEALYEGIKRLIGNPAILNHYNRKAGQRGKLFDTPNTVNAVEKILIEL